MRGGRKRPRRRTRPPRNRHPPPRPRAPARSPDDLLLLQRYASRRALLDVHQKAPEFFAFGRALLKADLVLEKTAEAYVELPPPLLDAAGEN